MLYKHSSSPFALLFIRLALGIVFIMHGYDKLFVAGIENTASFFERLNIPLPYLNAQLVSNLEFFGGILLVLGLLTRPLALMFMADMLVALFTVHLKNGFWTRDGGYEFVLVLAIVSLALVFSGAGSFSLDRLLFRRKGTPVPSQPFL